MTCTVVVVDDQALVRAGISRLLATEPGIEIVGEAGDGAAAVRLVQQARPDVALVDIRMPVLDGIAATRQIAASTSTHVVILTTFDLDEYVYEGLRAGASGFLLKDTAPDQLIAAVQIVARGDALIAPSVTRRLLDEFVRRPRPVLDAKFARLTERERDVLSQMGSGKSNVEIAATLFVGETTVKTHVTHVLEKLELRDRVQAVVYCYEHGLVVPGM